MGKESGKPPFTPPSYLKASWPSRITHWYLSPLFRRGYKYGLDEGDIAEVLPWNKSAKVGDSLQREWQSELHKKRPRLALALLRCDKITLVIQLLVALVQESLRMIQPIFLGLVLSYIQGEDVTRREAIIYVCILSMSGFLLSLLYALTPHIGLLIGTRHRAAVSTVIFRKMMSMSTQPTTVSRSGSILNMLATDVEKISRPLVFAPNAILAPLELVIVVVVLYREFDSAALVGMAVILGLIVIQQLAAKQYGKLRLKISYWTDKRTQMMNEVISGMRVIKMYCWEKPFGSVVSDIRRKEVRRNIEGRFLGSVIYNMTHLALKLTAMSVAVSYVCFHGELTSQKIFHLVAWLEVLRMSVFIGFGVLTQDCSQAYFSIQRIEKFLLTGELEDDCNIDKKPKPVDDNEAHCEVKNVGLDPSSSSAKYADLQGSQHATDDDSGVSNQDPSDTDEEEVVLSLQNVTATWNASEEHNQTDKGDHDKDSNEGYGEVFSLKNFSLDMKEGELVACVGPVGSGKSSLLMTILAQMPLTEGLITKKGSIMYVPQEAWVFSGTVRDNVLFGQPMDPERYEDVIRLCALARDIEKMPDGDLTLVGERGLSLSGGQKARINLARAIYREADIYLFDDPLSAVDSKVGNHLFIRCICQHLLGKTRLLVTHQLQYLKLVDRIMILKKGEQFASGSYNELSRQFDLASLLAKSKETHRDVAPVRSLSDRRFSIVQNPSDQGLAVGDTISLSLDDEFATTSSDSTKQGEEERMKGRVSTRVYSEYFKAGKGHIFGVLFLAMLCADKALIIVSDWWLASWAAWYHDEYPIIYNISMVDSDFIPPEVHDYMTIYAVFGVIILVASVIDVLLFTVFNQLASVTLHNRMFRKVLRAPLEFFERNSVGAVLNRFSRDVGFMDEVLPQAAFIVFSSLAWTLTILVFVCVLNPWAILATVPPVVIVIAIRQYSASTFRDIKRIEAVARSPVYAHVTTCLQGLPVIRAYHMQQKMIEHFDDLQDKHTAAWNTFCCAFRWMGLRFDLINTAYWTGMLFFAITLTESINGTLLGFGLVYIASLIGVVQYTVRQTSEVESYMTSVERILHYSKLDQEPPEHNEDNPVPPGWPSHGHVDFDHVTLTYSDGCKPALKDVSFSIKPGEKVGVVGRTGSGKSTLITALMRLVEPTGNIHIDGVSVTEAGLTDLRTIVSVIPQDPVLFSGTLRMNLDLFSEFEDDDLWKCIEEVQLKEKVDQLPGQLYGEIEEAGRNFSVGQKQLVCLARALLRQNNILVIDEATANVDQQTDSLIQQTIRERFRTCTVITIAHRLNTIMDSDKVLVLDGGEVQQYNRPFVLLQNEQGLFYQMVQQTGKKYADQLITVAQNKHNQLTAGLGVSSSVRSRDGSVAHEDIEEEEETTEDCVQDENKETQLGVANAAFTPSDDEVSELETQSGTTADIDIPSKSDSSQI